MVRKPPCNIDEEFYVLQRSNKAHRTDSTNVIFSGKDGYCFLSKVE